MKLVSKKNAAYVIAEVGQNHQGSYDIAKSYIDELSRIGVDAVKFQMRNNHLLFSKEKLSQPYNSSNSFGATYGEHREALELSVDEIRKLREHTFNSKMDFICTPFDEASLKHLVEMEVDAIKIASFDFGNFPFLMEVIETSKHFILSTGGSGYELVDNFISELIELNASFSLLHCVSEYPCPLEKVNLGRIKYLKECYPQIQIGLSDHYSGILTGPLGLICGAEVFEKHVTFNRSQKGTDHAFSLTIEAMSKFVRDINRTPILLEGREPEGLGSEYVFTKLGKSIVARNSVLKGEAFKTKDFTGVITGFGIPVRRSLELIGKVSKNDYQAGDVISEDELNE